MKGHNLFRKNTKKVLSVMMSLCMVFSLMLGTNTMIASAAEGDAKININVQQASDNETGGTVYYKVGDAGEWTDASTINPDASGSHWVPGVNAANTKVSLKVVVAEGYEIDTASVGVRGSGVALIEDEQDALVSENGYSYTIPAAGDYEFEIRFRSQNNDPNPPAQNDNGQLKFTCQGNPITGGSIEYKLDSATEFI